MRIRGHLNQRRCQMAKRNERKLVMHKLLGEHTMEKLTICTVCGITEGQQVVEPYKPVHMTADQVFELMKTIMELAHAVRQLQIDRVYRDRDELERRKRYELPWREQMVPKSPMPHEAAPDRSTKEFETLKKMLEVNPEYERELKKSFGAIEDWAKKG